MKTEQQIRDTIDALKEEQVETMNKCKSDKDLSMNDLYFKKKHINDLEHEIMSLKWVIDEDMWSQILRTNKKFNKKLIIINSLKPYGRDKKVIGFPNKVDYHLKKNKTGNWWEEIVDFMSRSRIKQIIRKDIDKEIND